MIRRFIAILMSLALCWTTVACGDSTPNQSQKVSNNATVTTPNQVTEGRYPVQQATYDDGDGTYTLMLLNTPPGKPSIYRTENLQMARLTDEQISKGEKTSVEINGQQAVMSLTEDFKIEYVHTVAETQPNPQTGQPQTVVRRESNFWAPFAGAMAGQALGSLLFRPQYYVPPIYQSGGVMSGYGGYGNTHTQAVNSYQTKYNSPPPVVKNRQTLRTTGNLRNSSSGSSTTRKPSSTSTKSSGSGFGSSNLQNSGKSTPKVQRSSGFGSSSGRRSSSRSFGRRR